jgi:hypothetical protein
MQNQLLLDIVGKVGNDAHIDTSLASDDQTSPYKDQKNLVKITSKFRFSILFDMPIYGGSLYIEGLDPEKHPSLFKGNVLEEVYKAGLLINGTQIFILIAIDMISNDLKARISLEELSKITKLSKRTIRLQLNQLIKGVLIGMDSKLKSGSQTLIQKHLIHEADTSNKLRTSKKTYKLAAEFFQKSTKHTKGNRRSTKDASGNILNFSDLVDYVKKFNGREYSNVVKLFIYINNMFSRKGASSTQHIRILDLKSKIFYVDVFHRNNIKNKIVRYLNVLKNIGYIKGFEMNIVNNKNEDAIRIEYDAFNIYKQKDSKAPEQTRILKTQTRIPKTQTRILKTQTRIPKTQGD